MQGDICFGYGPGMCMESIQASVDVCMSVWDAFLSDVDVSCCGRFMCRCEWFW
ncbi:hypothetical protein XF_2187 [Xylella fastidiosa 9a5c]|uniref:Uncharacterized protein n=1 Tax=Xylella fastidiosa (strain 9a5c) TaxID=160492 RepID=Q9PBF7_XYLFA|nr:hypothetical protein XF_2187 [Xylella fastidiosa 9a5c]